MFPQRGYIKIYRLTKKSDADKLPKFINRIEDVCSLLSNDLESVTIRTFSRHSGNKGRTVDERARGVLMSGSGPTVFGVFEDEQQRVPARGKSAEIRHGTPLLLAQYD